MIERSVPADADADAEADADADADEQGGRSPLRTAEVAARPEPASSGGPTEPTGPTEPISSGGRDRRPPLGAPILTVWRGGRPLVAMAVVGLALAWFLKASRHHPIPFGRFSHPPIYGFWQPLFTPAALIVVPAALLLWAVAVAITSTRRVPSWLSLGLVIAAGVVTAAAVMLARGDSHGPVHRLEAGFSSYYTADMHYVGQYGVRGFDERYPELLRSFQAHNTKTHPPGAVVLLHTLFSLFGSSHLLRTATLLAVLGMAAAVPAWLIGRELGGERAGRIAAVLFVAAPGPLLLAFVSLDAVYATGLSAATALFVLAVPRRSVRLSVAGGAVLGLTAYLTYAVSFVAIAFVVSAVITLRRPAVVAPLVGGAALGGVAVLALERLVLGYDVLATYRVAPHDGTSIPYDPYWIIGHPAAMLILAGLPLAAIGMVGLVRRAPGASFSVLPVTLVALMFVWGALPSVITHLRAGEVERTWAFLYPVLAATAAPLVDRWTHGRRWSLPVVLFLLIGLSVAQATVIRLLWVAVAP